MNIKLNNGKPAPEQSIRKLEAELGYKLSASFRAFVRTNDGAEPEHNKFRIDERDETGVRKFIPIAEIADHRRVIENLPKGAYPVAYDSFGNYVWVDEGRNGEVYFWDHERPEEITKVADHFDGFLAILKPFDPNSVPELEPGQVKRVWVNPDFLNNPAFLKAKKK